MPLLIGVLFLALGEINAQQKSTQDTTKKKSQIHILENEYGEFLMSDTLNIQRLIGNVKLLHDSDTIYCDSAFFYQERNTAEAFGDVLILQADGTEAIADYMRYTGNTKMVFMKGNVTLTDNKGNDLWSEEITYNLKTKIGHYYKNGTLLSGNTLLSSREAEYNLRTKEARFKRNVVVNDPEYHVLSKDLGYNTETKVVTFWDASVVTNEESMLQTSSGKYNTIDRTSSFTKRSSIFNDGQYIEADTLNYDKNSGWAIGRGNVIAIDTAQKSTLYSGIAMYNEITKKMFAFVNPILKTVRDNDSFYIRSDTIFSAPAIKTIKILSAEDSLQLTAEALLAGKENTDTVSATADDLLDDLLRTMHDDEDIDSVAVSDTLFLADTIKEKLVQHPKPDTVKLQGLEQNVDVKDIGTYRANKRTTLNEKADKIQQLTEDAAPSADTNTQSSPFVYSDSLGSDDAYYKYNKEPKEDTSLRYFVAYYNVRIYSDSLQGKCDSLYYSQADSTIRMIVNPILWTDKGQLKGDTIVLFLDSSKLREIFVPRNAILISRSGPEQAGFYNQIQGNTIRGFLSNNKIDSLIAQPNGMSIYYIQDESDAYVGVNESQSARIQIHFEDEEISTIYYLRDMTGATKPMAEIEPSTLRLSRFQWHENEKLKNFEAFLGDVCELPEPQLMNRK